MKTSLLLVIKVLFFCISALAQPFKGIGLEGLMKNRAYDIISNGNTTILQGNDELLNGLTKPGTTETNDHNQTFDTQISKSGTFTDSRDGKEYSSVQIGSQIWMAENLNHATSNSRCYGNSTAYCNDYGRLYTWFDAMAGASSSSANPSGVQGVCPPGWHLPSVAEWSQLLDYLNSQGYPNTTVAHGAGNALKSCRQVNSPMGGCNTSTHPRWNESANYHGTNIFGFSALPAGLRDWEESSDIWFGAGRLIRMWAATESLSIMNNSAHYYGMSYDNPRVSESAGHKKYYYSVRCVKDSDQVTSPPQHRDIHQETIDPGQSSCFDALKTISVADLIIQPGGSAQFIAGQSILFGPGTNVFAGGYLFAHISQTGSFCASATPSEISEKTDETAPVKSETSPIASKNAHFRVYPNPTFGHIFLDLIGEQALSQMVVDLYSIRGDHVMHVVLPAAYQHTLSLDKQQPGIYIIRIRLGNQQDMLRIIKQ